MQTFATIHPPKCDMKFWDQSGFINSTNVDIRSSFDARTNPVSLGMNLSFDRFHELLEGDTGIPHAIHDLDDAKRSPGGQQTK